MAICLDGTAPAYLEDALQRDLMPCLKSALDAGGALLRADAQVPTVTNVNNATIVTGVSAAVHGISGNHYLTSNGSELQLTDPAALRAQTIYAAAAQAGVPVLVVTAKDKLTRLLGAAGVPSISAERAHEQTVPGLDGQTGAEALGVRNPDGVCARGMPAGARRPAHATVRSVVSGISQAARSKWPSSPTKGSPRMNLSRLALLGAAVVTVIRARATRTAVQHMAIGRLPGPANAGPGR
jgi:hypothetical protein